MPPTSPSTTHSPHPIRVPRWLVTVMVVAALAAAATLAGVLASSGDEVSTKGDSATPVHILPSAPVPGAPNDGSQHSGARP
jgi:hypothetical protein